MNETSNLRFVLMCGLLLAGFWTVSAQAAASGSFQQTIPVDEPIVLDVSTGSGDISVRAGGSGQVKITGHIEVGEGSFLGLFKTDSDKAKTYVDEFESNPPVVFENGRLRVGHINNHRYGRNFSITYEILVPMSTEVKSNTGSGSQEINNVAGPVEVRTGSGRIELHDIDGAVSAQSGSGSITAEEIGGAFEAHSGSGKIRLLQSAPGDVFVTTGSGSSELRNVVGALKVKAGSGRITVDGRQDGEWDLDTSSGSVRVSLPQDAAFDLDADSGSGGIDIDHPVAVQGKISERHLRGTVRGGGDLLKIDTGSGSIRIE